MTCQDVTFNATQPFIQLGLVPYPSKSVFQSTQILEFLGFLLNSVKMTVSLTKKKLAKVGSCQTFLHYKQFSIRDLASLIGTLVYTFPGVEKHCISGLSISP